MQEDEGNTQEAPMTEEATPKTTGGDTKLDRKKIILLAGLLIGAIVILSTSFVVGSRLGPKPTPTPTPSPIPSPSLTPSPTIPVTPTRKPTPQPTNTPKPTNTPIPVPTVTPSATPTTAPFTVTGITAAVAPTSSNTCPTTFNFSATITANAAGEVTYKWERSDSASPPTESVTFTAAESKVVTSTWSIGAAGTHWKRVHILTPNDTLSNQASFTLTCP